jgi:hypothetical protein
MSVSRFAFLALLLAVLRDASTTADKIPIMATTTSNSISVNPRFRDREREYF